jgi:hypothetical protein
MIRRAPTLFALLAACEAAPALAIVPNPPPRVCTEYLHSDFVFVGDVLGFHILPVNGRTIDYAETYRVRVRRVLKGRLPMVIALHTSNTTAKGILKVGSRSTIFGYRWHGRYMFSGGGNSDAGHDWKQVLRELHTWQAHPGTLANISGRVDIDYVDDTTPRQMLSIEVRSATGARRLTRSDRFGHFSVDVPPGIWSVRVVEPGWRSETEVYSYQDAGRIKLPPSGCADLELRAIPIAGR